MLQVAEPDTFVLATNRTSSVRDFVALTAKAAGFDLEFKGQAENEVGIDIRSGRTIVRINPKFYRPAEVDLLIGDASKAKEKLGWVPETSLETLCELMFEADLRRNTTGVSF
jgi:GDPmannose 4,6-dehydratase